MPLPTEDILETDAPATSYRALCPLAVSSVAVGVVSIPILVFWFSWFWAIVPLAGILLARQGLIEIGRAPQELTGRKLALLGIWLCAAMWGIGYGWLILYDVREVPPGYERVEWDALQPAEDAKADPIPQKARDLAEKEQKIYIKGYMRPGRQSGGIKDFVFCPANGDCPFCIPNPKPTQMIHVQLQGDASTVYTTRHIGVGGRFRLDDKNFSSTPYILEADYLR
jgi:hypothetical protein